MSIDSTFAMRQQDAILEKNAKGRKFRYRSASRKRFEPCPKCNSIEDMIGWWEGRILVLMCLRCNTRGIIQR